MGIGSVSEGFYFKILGKMLNFPAGSSGNWAIGIFPYMNGWFLVGKYTIHESCGYWKLPEGVHHFRHHLLGKLCFFWWISAQMAPSMGYFIRWKMATFQEKSIGKYSHAASSGVIHHVFNFGSGWWWWWFFVVKVVCLRLANMTFVSGTNVCFWATRRIFFPYCSFSVTWYGPMVYLYTWNAKCPIFLGNFAPKTSNFWLKNRALGFPGRWWFQIFFMFTPTWGSFPSWRAFDEHIFQMGWFNHQPAMHVFFLFKQVMFSFQPFNFPERGMHFEAKFNMDTCFLSDKNMNTPETCCFFRVENDTALYFVIFCWYKLHLFVCLIFAWPKSFSLTSFHAAKAGWSGAEAQTGRSHIPAGEKEYHRLKRYLFKGYMC